MSKFRGFPEGKVYFTPIPAPFFNELLPEVDHLGELKLILYFFWRLDRMEGTFRCLQRSDLVEDERFMQALGEAPEQVLDEALEKAVERGVLLQARGSDGSYYFLNSPKGRAGVRAIEQGLWRPAVDGQPPIELGREAPNIFRLYEENIGPITPLIADALRDAEETYPEPWLEEAFRIAVESNKRSWRYVSAILERWFQEGRDERKDRRDSEKDRRRYSEWENPDVSHR
ncbi:MAG: DnaD domain protein [Chloroflexi bacterium]|jgi:DNA replication protein|nr:DnaD domain protein [Chloroflexota bacterium]